MKKITLNYQGPNFQITIEGETGYDISYDLQLILESKAIIGQIPEPPPSPIDADFPEVDEAVPTPVGVPSKEPF